MAKMIRITTDYQIQALEFPEDETWENTYRIISNAVHPNCKVLRFMFSSRLHDAAGDSRRRENVEIVCDVDAYYHNRPVNLAASFMNEVDLGSDSIYGDILIINKTKSGVGFKMTGLNERQFNRLWPKMVALVDSFR